MNLLDCITECIWLKFEAVEAENHFLPFFPIIVADLSLTQNNNDTFGHETGDQMLISVSEIIKENIWS